MPGVLRLASVLGVVLGLLVAVGAYAWDESKADTIADGVRVGQVHLGGLKADEAKRVLRKQLVEPLKRPVRVRVDHQTFRLSAERLEVRAPIGAMVAEARSVSREDGLPARIWRYVTDGEVEHSIEPRSSYSKQAVDEFIEEIAAAVEQAATDATLDTATKGLTVVEGSPGRALAREGLRDAIFTAIEKAGERAVIKAKTERTEPEVTADELGTSYPTYITVSRDDFKLRYFENLELVETYTIAVGQQGYETPAGLYAIESKQVDPTWYVPEADWAGDLAGETVPPGPDNPLKARWMGFAGAAGIHGTADADSLGGAASHGCVRMAVPDVKELYERVDIGTPVFIE